jgi:hypothetical protein
MSNEKYNGWTNYETWKVNLEIFDNLDLSEFGFFEDIEAELIDAYELGQAMKEKAEFYIECGSESGFARDFALAFLSDVNWHEIATHMIDNYLDNEVSK